MIKSVIFIPYIYLIFSFYQLPIYYFNSFHIKYNHYFLIFLTIHISKKLIHSPNRKYLQYDAEVFRSPEKEIYIYKINETKNEPFFESHNNEPLINCQILSNYPLKDYSKFKIISSLVAIKGNKSNVIPINNKFKHQFTSQKYLKQKNKQ